MQAGVFLERFKARRCEVIPDGEVVRSGATGNHKQGTLFCDGRELLSPEVARAFDELASGFANPDGHRIDFGRFDVRFASDEAFRRVEDIGVIEFNGNTAESTDLYDPKNSLLKTYAILFKQWYKLFQLGALRRKTGGKAIKLVPLIRALRKEAASQTAPRVSD